MTIYYVYAYLRLDGSPYYIGKGSGKRAWYKGLNEIGRPTDKSRITIVENNLTEIGALALERRLIRWYGRKDLGTGILRNKTDGGDSPPIFVSHTKESRQKISDALKGKKLSPEHIENLKKAKKYISQETRAKMSAARKGKKFSPHSNETKKKISDAQKGKKISEEQKRKISASLTGRKHTEETKRKMSNSKMGKKNRCSEKAS